MDVRAPQVALSTVIGELTLNNTEEFGVDYFLQFEKNNWDTTSAWAALLTTPLPRPGSIRASLITFPVFYLRSGATAYIAAGNTVSAIVKALESTGRFKSFRGRWFSRAITRRRSSPPAGDSRSRQYIAGTTGGGIITPARAKSNIQFKKVALQLEVVPLINSEKEVSLDILQKIDSSCRHSTTVEAIQLPTIATRYIRSTVSAPNGATIVLGGLIQG